jgi:hypothetical protein
MKLNNIPLELDDRIFDIADIKTVITADEKDVGKMGHFANSIQYFKDLKGSCIKYGKLLYLHDLNRGGDKSDQCFVCDNHWAYRYFIPEEKLLPAEKPEKRYRPFSLEEFLEIFGMGDRIDFKGKGCCDEVKVAMFTGYITDVDRIDDKTPGACEVMLGIFHYSLFSLFEDFELFFDGKWQPFGVLVEDKL